MRSNSGNGALARSGPRGGRTLYDGEATAGFGERLYAVPLRQLWEGRPQARG